MGQQLWTCREQMLNVIHTRWGGRIGCVPPWIYRFSNCACASVWFQLLSTCCKLRMSAWLQESDGFVSRRQQILNVGCGPVANVYACEAGGLCVSCRFVCLKASWSFCLSICASVFMSDSTDSREEGNTIQPSHVKSRMHQMDPDSDLLQRSVCDRNIRNIVHIPQASRRQNSS